MSSAVEMRDILILFISSRLRSNRQKQCFMTFFIDCYNYVNAFFENI